MSGPPYYVLDKGQRWDPSDSVAMLQSKEICKCLLMRKKHTLVKFKHYNLQTRCF